MRCGVLNYLSMWTATFKTIILLHSDRLHLCLRLAILGMDGITLKCIGSKIIVYYIILYCTCIVLYRTCMTLHLRYVVAVLP